MEGWLRTKGQHVNLWRERYFILREEAGGETRLLYFRKESDLVSRTGLPVKKTKKNSSACSPPFLRAGRAARIVRHRDQLPGGPCERAAQQAGDEKALQLQGPMGGTSGTGALDTPR